MGQDFSMSLPVHAHNPDFGVFNKDGPRGGHRPDTPSRRRRRANSADSTASGGRPRSHTTSSVSSHSAGSSSETEESAHSSSRPRAGSLGERLGKAAVFITQRRVLPPRADFGVYNTPPHSK